MNLHEGRGERRVRKVRTVRMVRRGGVCERGALVQRAAMSFPLSDAEREALLLTRLRLMKLPPERIIDVQTAPPDPLKHPFDGVADDVDSARAALLVFLKAVNELCDGALRKQGRVNRSAVDAVDYGFAVIAKRFGWASADAVAELRALRDARAAARGLDIAALDAAVAARAAARNAKDFDAADRLHKELVAQGVVVVDDKDGSGWTLAAEAKSA